MVFCKDYSGGNVKTESFINNLTKSWKNGKHGIQIVLFNFIFSFTIPKKTMIKIQITEEKFKHVSSILYSSKGGKENQGGYGKSERNIFLSLSSLLYLSPLPHPLTHPHSF